MENRCASNKRLQSLLLQTNTLVGRSSSYVTH